MSDKHLLSFTTTVTQAQEMRQYALAEKLGCNVATISRWRRNGVPQPWKYILQALQEQKITFDDLKRWQGAALSKEQESRLKAQLAEYNSRNGRK